MTASLHKLTAGDGYTYLTRQVAVLDSTELGRQSHHDYYSAKGESPGRWRGRALESLGMLEVGDAVTEAQMRALFGEGRHPCADDIERAATARAVADGATEKQAEREALGASKLGAKFGAYDDEPSEFVVRLGRAYRAHNADVGAARDAAIPEKVRAEIRSRVGRETFVETYGREPTDDRELSAHIARSTRPPRQPVAGYDVTFSPVKSVSTLWAVAPREVSEQIEEAHKAAVEDAMDWIERTVSYTRRGRGGVRQVDINGLLMASFTHRDSRAGDPDLHTHVAVSNKVQALDGSWLALDGQPLHQALVAASERYNTRLEAEVTTRLGVGFAERIDPSRGTKRAVREVEGVSPELMARWSSRRAQIDARRAELATEFTAAHGRPPTPKEQIALAQQATLDTREAKHEPRSLEEQRAAWRAEALDVLGHDGLDSMIATTTSTRAPEAVHLSAQERADLAREALQTVENDRARWQMVHVRAEVERRVRARGVALEVLDETVEDCIDRALSPALSVSLTPPEAIEVPAELRRLDGSSQYHRAHSTLFSSERVMAAEESIVEAARRRDGHTISEDAVAIALLEAAANGTALNPAQTAMVTSMATSGARVQLGLAPAGSGKTTAMRALSRAWSDDGGTVIGLAPSAVAATELGSSIGTDADTLAKLVWHLDHPAGAPSWMHEIDQRTLVVIDEAGMASTPELAAAIDFVTARGGSVRLIGDDQQLAAVGAGGVLRDIATEVGADQLEELHRFSSPAEAEATLALRDGRADALGFYLDNGRVRVAADTEGVLGQVFEAWQADTSAGRDALMLAATREEVATLNDLARTDRLGETVQDGPSVALGSGGRASVGDRIITRRNDRRLPITRTHWTKNGDRFTVAAVHGDGSLSATHDATGQTITLPASYVSDHVDLGYATTYHGAQGATVDATHCALTGSESRQLLYVGMSRGRHANHVYVPVSGDGDDHAAIHPDTLHPRTAVDILEKVLARDDAPRSARTEVREAHDPVAQLRAAVEQYAESVDLAAQLAIGPEAVDRLTEEAHHLHPGLSESPAWDTLLGHLCRIEAEAPGTALGRLRQCVSRRELNTALDPAAVLDWRLDSTRQHSAAPGPLPWLAAPPSVPDPRWSEYLRDLAALVTARAADVDAAARATTEQPWAAGLGDDADLRADLAVWRAALGVDDGRSPTGPTRLAHRERRHQQDLDARVTAHRGAPLAPGRRWVEAVADERVTADPFWPVLGERLDAIAAHGGDVLDLLAQALARGPLPDDHPAAALASRPVGAAPARSAGGRMRPPWTHVLVDQLPSALAATVTTSPAWPDLVEAVDTAVDGGDPTPLLRTALGMADVDRIGQPDGLPPEALASALAAYVRDLGDSSRITDPDPDETEVPAAPQWEAPPSDDEPDDIDVEVDAPADIEEAFPSSRTPHDRILDLTRQAAAWYAQQLDGSTAQAYLHGRTGTADLGRYTLGYAPEGWTNLTDHLREHAQATDTELVDAGLAKWSKRGTLYDVFRDRLLFGLHNRDGDLVGFVGRRSPGSDDGPKYLNTPETAAFHKGQVLFGLTEGRADLDAGASPVRVEGTLDAIAITAASGGRLVGVAPLGTALTPTQTDELVAAAGDDGTVLVAPDNDEAGLNAAVRDYWLLTERGVDPRVLPVPGGDAADVWQDQPDLLSAIAASAEHAPPLASTVIDRRLALHTDHLDRGWVAARVNAARAVAPVIASTPLQQWPQHVADVTARLGDDAAEDLVWSEVLAAAIPWNPLVEDPGVDVDQQEVTTARASLAELAAQIDALDSGNADRSTALDTLAEALDEQTERLERDRRRRAERAADPAPERDHDPRRSPGDDGPAPRRGGPRR